MLDGSNTRVDLIARVFSLAQGGTMHVRDASGAVIAEEAQLRDIAAKSVDGCLRGLAGVPVAEQGRRNLLFASRFNAQRENTDPSERTTKHCIRSADLQHLR